MLWACTRISDPEVISPDRVVTLFSTLTSPGEGLFYQGGGGQSCMKIRKNSQSFLLLMY